MWNSNCKEREESRKHRCVPSMPFHKHLFTATNVLFDNRDIKLGKETKPLSCFKGILQIPTIVYR